MPRTSLLLLAVVALFLLVGAFALGIGRGSRPQPVRASLSVSDVLGGEPDERFARALAPRAFRFPADHGPHPEFRTEWWYLTGNLEGAGGRPFGFQLTLFRSALAPPAHGGEAQRLRDGPAPRLAPPAHGGGARGAPALSSWSSDQVYMGHLALTDAEAGTFRAFERFSRGALGLAGARAEPFRVWLEDWVLEGPAQAGQDIFSLTLTAGEGESSLRLVLEPAKPLVLQGENGLSQKGPEPGNASYYYSFTRLLASGTLEIGGETVGVSGTAWMDREWSTSALSAGQVGWDWFALQLDDGHDLMFYQLRLEDGSPDPLSKGSWVDPEGGSRVLGSEEVELEVLDWWTSPLDGASYPARWALRVPSEALEVEVVPLLPDQELELTFRYWEGAVRVRGSRAGTAVEGMGYVELTGYASLPARDGLVQPRR